MVTLGAKADAKSTATDTTSITLMQVAKQISASAQLISTALAQRLLTIVHRRKLFWQPKSCHDSSASTYDASAQAWFDAVVAAGGAVSTTQKGRVNTLVLALKSASLFSGRLWIHAGESDAKQATIDLINLATAAPQSSPTLGASGYTGNGSSSYIDYGTLPTEYTPTSASFGAYNTNNSTTQNFSIVIGMNDSNFADILPSSVGLEGWDA
jgi:hypothetical protein